MFSPHLYLLTPRTSTYVTCQDIEDRFISLERRLDDLTEELRRDNALLSRVILTEKQSERKKLMEEIRQAVDTKSMLAGSNGRPA